MKVKDLSTYVGLFTTALSLSTSNTYKQMVSVVRFHVYEGIQIKQFAKCEVPPLSNP